MKQIIVIFISIIIASCSRTIYRGSQIENTEILSKQTLNKEQLIDKFGPPTFIPDYTPNVWYYISMRMQKLPLFLPTLKEERVLKVIFDQNNNVKDFTFVDILPDQNIQIINDFTRVEDTEETNLKHFVKNFGRFSFKSKQKRR